MQNLKKYSILGAVILCLCFGSYLAGKWNRGNQGAILVSAPVPEHDVSLTAPLKAKDKKSLKERGEIPKEVAIDGKQEVIATGTKTDDTGTTHVSAVVNTATGEGVIIQHRPAIESFLSHEIGAGLTVGSLGIGEAFRYRATVGRLWGLYAEGQIEAWRWEWGPRFDSGHRYDGQVTAFITYRFP